MFASNACPRDLPAPSKASPPAFRRLPASSKPACPDGRGTAGVAGGSAILTAVWRCGGDRRVRPHVGHWPARREAGERDAHGPRCRIAIRAAVRRRSACSTARRASASATGSRRKGCARRAPPDRDSRGGAAVRPCGGDRRVRPHAGHWPARRQAGGRDAHGARRRHVRTGRRGRARIRRGRYAALRRECRRTMTGKCARQHARPARSSNTDGLPRARVFPAHGFSRISRRAGPRRRCVAYSPSCVARWPMSDTS